MPRVLDSLATVNYHRTRVIIGGWQYLSALYSVLFFINSCSLFYFLSPYIFPIWQQRRVTACTGCPKSIRHILSAPKKYVKSSKIQYLQELLYTIQSFYLGFKIRKLTKIERKKCFTKRRALKNFDTMNQLSITPRNSVILQLYLRAGSKLLRAWNRGNLEWTRKTLNDVRGWAKDILLFQRRP